MNQADPSGAGIALLRSVALRAETATRLEAELQTTLLRSIVDTTVAIFEAEASSIALYRPDEDVLEFVIAAGAHGQEVVGLKIPPSQGIAGYAFTTSEPLAISDPSQDPRFGVSFSADTGYVPRSILAVPMRSGGRPTGVLEVLDKKAGTFSMRDIAIASTFADQAAVAIRVGARALQAQSLLRLMLAGGIEALDATDAAALELMVSKATRAERDDPAFWEFVDAIVGMRIASPEDRSLAIEVLALARRHAASQRPGTIRFRR
jgi:GAF domain-containing protein